MARIAGVDIPNDKRVVISLTYIYGIGKSTAKQVLEQTGISEDIRVKDLDDEQMNKIRKAIDEIKVEGDLRREVQLNIKRLMEIGCYRGEQEEVRRVETWRNKQRQEKEESKRILPEAVLISTQHLTIQL